MTVAYGRDRHVVRLLRVAILCHSGGIHPAVNMKIVVSFFIFESS